MKPFLWPTFLQSTTLVVTLFCWVKSIFIFVIYSENRKMEHISCICSPAKLCPKDNWQNHLSPTQINNKATFHIHSAFSNNLHTVRRVSFCKKRVWQKKTLRFNETRLRKEIDTRKLSLSEKRFLKYNTTSVKSFDFYHILELVS